MDLATVIVKNSFREITTARGLYLSMYECSLRERERERSAKPMFTYSRGCVPRRVQSQYNEEFALHETAIPVQGGNGGYDYDGGGGGGGGLFRIRFAEFLLDFYPEASNP
ncbi:hypothetical protein M0802_010882 [Mischocyttarus mexicanus]|nr:hypothetical protein M0802_010882 [Mischocyttarus mexicanus]